MDHGFGDLNNTHKKKKKHKKSKEYDKVEATIDKCFTLATNSTFFDNCATPGKKKHKKGGDGLYEIEEFADNNSEILSVKGINTDRESYEKKKKRKKNKEQIDSSSIEENAFSEHSEIVLNNEGKKKTSKENNLNVIEEFADVSFQTVPVEKHRKKHERIIEENTFLNDPETISIDKQRKRKDETAKQSCDLNNVDHDSSEFNIVYKSKKHKIPQDFQLSEKTTVFDESEICFINKQKKKKHKKAKESCDLNETEGYANNNSEIPRKKHTIEEEINNISPNGLEFNITHKHKKKKHDLDITKENIVFNDSRLTAVNEQIKKEHKKGKESNYLNKTKEFADNNSENKRNDESHDLNIMDHLSSAINLIYENEKGKEETTLLSESEITSIHKQKKKKRRNVDESYDSIAKNMNETFVDNAEINCTEKHRKKHKSYEVSKNLNNIDLDNSECSATPESKKKHKKNDNLSVTEIFSVIDNSKLTSTINDKRKKHKKKEENSDLNTIVSANHLDYSEMASNKKNKHKKHKKSQNLRNEDNEENQNKEVHKRHHSNDNLSIPNNRLKEKNIDDTSAAKCDIEHTDNSECSATPESKKKHKKNDNLSVTETFSVIDNSKLTSTINDKRKKHKKKEDNSDLNAIESANHLDYSDMASNKKNKHKKHKNSQNLRNEDNEENQNKEVHKNRKRHHSNNNLSISNNMLKEKNIDSNIDDTSAAKSDIEHTDNSDQSSFESEDLIRQNRRKTLEKDELLHLDFTEDILEFELPLLHETEKLTPLTEEQNKHLESQGVTIRTGKFSRKEEEILKKNFKKFTKKYGVSDPIVLFGIGRYGVHNGIKKFIKAKHFYARLGKGLDDRTLISIYKRARKFLSPFKNKGNFDGKDVSVIKKVHKDVSNKWCHIGSLLERSGDACLSAYKWHKKPVSKGKWTEEEKNKLVEAIKTVSGSSDLSCDKIKSISWLNVANYIPTRNSSQCRQYWSDNFGWKSDAGKKWSKKSYVKLIRILNKQWNVEDETMIDWCKVHESFEDAAPSYTFLRKRWSYLKCRIPNYKNKNYNQILKLLHLRYNISDFE